MSDKIERALGPKHEAVIKYENEIKRLEKLNEKIPSLEKKTKEIPALENQINVLKSEIATLEAEVASCPKALAKTQNENQKLNKQIDELKADNKKLTETNRLALVEIDSLKAKNSELEKILPKKHSAPTTVLEKIIKSNFDKRAKIVNSLAASLNGMTYDSEASSVLIQGVKAFGFKITGKEFVKLLSAADIGFDTDLADTITALAPYLIYPLNEIEITEIFSTFTSDSDRQIASSALIRAQQHQMKSKNK